MRQILTFAIKFGIALGLIYWLFKSGKIDFSLLLVSFNKHPSSWFLAFGILSFNIMLVTIRWKKILETKSKAIFPYLTILKLTWIGGLFNSVLPGAVSGDFIKLVYAKKVDPELSKTFLITSVLMDRILGLFALLILMGFASIIKYKELISASPSIVNLIHLNFFIFMGMILLLLTLFLPEKQQSFLFKIGAKIPLLGKQLNKTMSQFWIIGKNKKNIFKLIALSMFTQTLGIFAFWVLASPFFEYASAMSKTLTIFDGLTFIPLGFVVIAIPITPAGLGVGHVAFNTLFSYFGVNNGASLFNFYLMISIFVNLLGIFPYLMGRKDLSSPEMQKNLEDFSSAV